MNPSSGQSLVARAIKKYVAAAAATKPESRNIYRLDLADRIEMIASLTTDDPAIASCLSHAAANRTLNDLARETGLEAVKILEFAQRNLGHTVFVASLPDEGDLLSALEVVRWPSHRHSISKSYWRNCIDVRRQLATLEASENREQFVRSLCGLHVVQMMGRNLDSFYVPKAAARCTGAVLPIPGAIRPRHDVICFGGGDGPKERDLVYVDLLQERFPEDRRNSNSPLIDAHGVLYGECRWTWMDRGLGQRSHIYCPTSGVLDGQIEALYQTTLELCRIKVCEDKKPFIRSAARFLQTFVAVHPFVCGNMSLAMNILNSYLRRHLNGYVLHTALDWVAQRVSFPHFEQYMARYLEEYLVSDEEDRSVGWPIPAALKMKEFLEIKGRALAEEWIAREHEHKRVLLLQ